MDMKLVFGLLLWGAIGYGVWLLFWWLVSWWLVRKSQTRIIPPAEGKDFEVITPATQPLNSDIMRKLNSMHEDIENIEARTEKLEKSVKNISGLPWWLWISLIIISIFYFYRDS